MKLKRFSSGPTPRAAARSPRSLVATRRALGRQRGGAATANICIPSLKRRRSRCAGASGVDYLNVHVQVVYIVDAVLGGVRGLFR